MTAYREFKLQERQDRDNKILGLVKDGYSLASVGDVFGLSARQVKNILHRVGYKKPKPVNPDHVEMLRLRNEGSTLQVIGDKYGITRERVRQITDKMGYVKPEMPSKEELRYQALQEKKEKKIVEFHNNVVAVGNDKGCWEWQGRRWPTGYGTFSAACLFGRKERYTHRLAWILKYGEIPEGMDVLHTCDNPPCCRPSHLFLGTAKDNTHDAIKKGRFKPWGKTMKKK